MRIMISFMIALMIVSPAWSAQEWDKSIPCKTGVGSCGSADQRADFPADQQANNAALDRLLANYRQGMTLSYSSATTVSVSAGEVVCSTAAGDVRKMRQNTSATNVTFTDIDTGVEEASKTYYIYANCDADATTSTFKVSASSTAPTGVTHFKRLGSFYNDASSNIAVGGVSNDTNIFGSSIGTIVSKTGGVTYQAITDGYVSAWANGGNSETLALYSDSSSSPTTLIDYASAGLGVNGENINVGGLIKKGNYYKTVNSVGSVTMYFTPIGN